MPVVTVTMRTQPVAYSALRLALAAVTLLTALLPTVAQARSPQPATFYNGFDVSDSLIPLNTIDHGGPGRDGIPALDHPKFISGAARDNVLAAADRVMGVHYNGVAKAYPIRILDHHEVVNDRYGDVSLSITFCPLCGSGMVFYAGSGDTTMNFGVSGLLYNSDVLLYDSATQSLWSQLMKTAVTGPLKGETLNQVPAQYTSWGHWREQYPDSLLLSTDTGFERDYSGELYSGYRQLPSVRFATNHQDLRLTAKEWVVGVTLDGASLAIPFTVLAAQQEALTLALAGESIEIRWSQTGKTARAFGQDGREIPVTAAYWFAWVAFHPKTLLYPQDF